MAKRNVSLAEMRKRRSVDEKKVRRHRDAILAESRAVRLSEFRKSLDLTQKEMAEILGIDQSNVSRIEKGNLKSTEIGTLSSYIEALGGKIEIHVRMGKKSHRLLDSETRK